MKSFLFVAGFLVLVITYLPVETLAQLSPPRLDSPENEETGVSLTPTLEWRAPRGAAHYTVQLGLDDLFRNPIINERNVTGTLYDVRGLRYNTTYYWRIIAFNDAGENGVSKIWSFTTLTEPRRAPSAPVLVSPDDEATDVSITPTLVWESSGDVDHFTLHVLSLANFSDLVIDQSNITGNTYEVNALDYSTTYYWRVMGHNDGGESPWSEEWSFTTEEDPVQPPSAPVLVSPDDEATDVSITPTLVWESSGEVDHFTLQVASLPDFSNLVINEDNITETSYEVNALDYSTTYYWRVMGHNDAGDSPWSEEWSFTTMDDPARPPLAPVLVSPEDETTGVSVTPTLVWESPGDTGHHTLQLATDEGFTDLVIDEGNITETTYDVNALQYSTTYYWCVMGHNDAGDSPWSEERSFTTMDDPARPPLAPELISPEDEATGVSVTPTLVWESPGDTGHHTLHLAADEGFTDLVIDEGNITETTYEVNALQYNTTYYWRVMRHNDAGDSPWSEDWNFTTMDQPLQRPSPPVLVSPGDETNDVSVTPTLVWESPGDVDHFTLQVATIDDFSSLVIEEADITDTSYEMNDLENGVTYYWRVIAFNAAGESDWSEVWRFTTQVATGVSRLGQDIPVHYSLEQNYPNPFNPSTIIRYSLPEQSMVQLVVADLLGRKIAVLVDDEQAAGTYEVHFEAGDLASGVYLYRLQVYSREAVGTGSEIRTGKMTLLR